MNFTLQRICTSDNGTFGVLLKDDMPMFVTLELPWKSNQNDISCIPEGTYPCVKIFSPRFKRDLFVLQNVPNRSMVEIHIGNTIKDTHGCVLLGMQFNINEYAIVSSKLAFDNFMLIAPIGGFTLTVKDLR